MKIDILTLFPEMFKGPFDESMIKMARKKKLVEINIHNLRGWTKDKHKTVDDRPYGGGKGMVIRVDIVDSALKDLRTEGLKKLRNKEQKHRTRNTEHGTRVILLSPQGTVFNQQTAKKLSKLNHIIIIAGHYEGFDERIREHLVDEEISIGDYVLTGGELPAMVIVDTIARLLPGVLDKEVVEHESFSRSTGDGPRATFLLDYPTYSRPENFKGWKVPKVLLSGNHAEIEKWRKKESEKRTTKKRPDL